MLERITEFIGRCEDVLAADIQLIATSRPVSYSDQFDPDSFVHFVLETMDEEKVAEYTEKWIKAKSLDSPKAHFLRESVRDCLRDTNFASLMTTPLQVTIFIVIILSGGTPPRQREELFDEYLEIIHKRERSKSRTIIQTDKRLLFGLHQYMGYLLHRRAIGSEDTGSPMNSRMREDEFTTEVLRYLRHDDPYTHIEVSREKAGQLIQEAHERLVLIVSPEPSLFGFELRSIQEFFAAGHLVDTASDDDQRFRRFQAIALPAHWRNVALFFAGRVARCYPGEAAHVLEVCREIDRHKPDYFIRRGASLALEIAVDRSFGPKRMLQRSALEYALSVLEDNASSTAARDIAPKLAQLPPEDVRDHVIPILEERLHRPNASGRFRILDVYSAMSADRAPVIKMLERVASLDKTPDDTLLNKAIEYRLPASYVASRFAAILRANQESAKRFLIPQLASNPYYICDVMRQCRFDESVVSYLLAEVLDQRLVEAYGASRSHPREAFGDIYAQAATAVEWAGCLPHMQAPWDRVNWELPVTTPDTIVDDALASIANDNSLLQMRAVALALLAKLWPSNVGTERLITAVGALRHSITSEQTEKIDRILHLLQAPSLDVLESIEEDAATLPTLAQLRARTTKETATDLIGTWDPVYALALHVTDPFSQSDTEKLLGEQPLLQSTLFASQPLAVLKWWARVETRRLLEDAPEELPSGFLSRVVQAAGEKIASGGAVAWRGWETLSNVQRLKWGTNGTWQDTDQVGGLSSTLPLVFADGNPPITPYGFIHNLSHWSEAKDLVLMLLRAYPASGDQWWSRIQAARSGFRAAESLGQVFALAGGDAAAFRGFLRWFTEVVYAERTRVRTGHFKMQKFEFGIDVIRPVLDDGDEHACEGALLFLAHCGKVTVAVFEEVSRHVRQGSYRVAAAWADLLSAAVQDADDQTSLELLESILSSGSTYPSPLRGRAADLYQRVARSSTIDVVQQEESLGLPLQPQT